MKSVVLVESTNKLHALKRAEFDNWHAVLTAWPAGSIDSTSTSSSTG